MSQDGYRTYKEILPQHVELMKAIGNKIKELRTKENKGYLEMAQLIGISRQEYLHIELGQIYFKLSTLLKILDYHCISYTDFNKSL